MAKRGAEAVACRAPWETVASHAPSKRARSEPVFREPRCGKTAWSGVGGAKKRKRAEEQEEAAPGKRPAALTLGGPHEEQEPTGRTSGLEERKTWRQEQPRPPPLGDGEADSGGGLSHPWGPQASMAEEHEDDTWHYNSFQYWRSPLPVIDLSDILNLEKENMTKTRHCSSADLSEMET